MKEAEGCALALLAVVGILVLAATLSTVPLFLCWNYVLIDVFPEAHLHPVTWLQAFGLAVFIRILVPATKAGDAKGKD